MINVRTCFLTHMFNMQPIGWRRKIRSPVSKEKNSSNKTTSTLNISDVSEWASNKQCMWSTCCQLFKKHLIKRNNFPATRNERVLIMAYRYNESKITNNVFTFHRWIHVWYVEKWTPIAKPVKCFHLNENLNCLKVWNHC